MIEACQQHDAEHHLAVSPQTSGHHEVPQMLPYSHEHERGCLPDGHSTRRELKVVSKEQQECIIMTYKGRQES